MAKKKKASSTDPSKDDIRFESALAEVEQIVDELESGEAGLTESLAHYETGIKRLKQCHQLLQAAERRITLLSGFDADGNPVTEPLDCDDETPRQAKRKSRSVKRKVDEKKDAASTKNKSANRSSKQPPAAEHDADDGLSNSGDNDLASDDSSVDDLPGLF